MNPYNNIHTLEQASLFDEDGSDGRDSDALSIASANEENNFGNEDDGNVVEQHQLEAIVNVPFTHKKVQLMGP